MSRQCYLRKRLLRDCSNPISVIHLSAAQPQANCKHTGERRDY